MANKIDIKRGAATVATVSPLLSSNAVLDEQVTLSWEQPAKVDLKLNDFILFDGVKYTLNELPTVKKISTRHWRYNAVFQAPVFDLVKVSYLFPATGQSARGDFPLTGTPDVFMGLLVANLNRVYPGVWSLGSVITGEAKTLTFSEDDNCLSVLNKLADEYDTEVSLSGYAINLNKVTRASALSLEYGSTLYDVERKSVERNSAVTRLRAFGSTRNLPANYRGGSPRLLLPAPQQYVERGVAEHGIIEGKKNFDHIYPRLASGGAGAITAVGDMFTLADAVLDFDINAHLLPGTPAKVKFLTGQCAGYECEIQKYTHAEKKITVIPNKDDKGFEVPSAAVKPAVGDKYVLLDINMPLSYRTAAENELKAAAEKWLADNPPTKCEYSITFSDVYARANNVDIRKNDMIQFVDAQFGINEPLRVVKVTKGVADTWNIKIDISNTIARTTWERLTSDVKKNEQAVREIRGGMQQSFARNWQQVEELSAMIETLRADMLVVGNVQGQFEIKTTLFSPNYSGNVNQFYATTGTLAHKMVPTPDAPKTWTMAAYNNSSLVSGTAYYLYARCGKNANTGTFVLSSTPHSWDTDATYYYFPVGVLSSVVNGFRTLQTTYGFSQISGKQITTGRIQSPAGRMYIDLEEETISGNIKFLSTSGQEKGIEEGISEAVDNIQVGSRNLLLGTKGVSRDSKYNIARLKLCDDKPAHGEQVTIAFRGELGAGKTQFGLYNSSGNEYIENVRERDKGPDGIYRKTFAWRADGTANTELWIYVIPYTVTVESWLENVMLVRGNKIAYYQEAPEDLQIGGRNLLLGTAVPVKQNTIGWSRYDLARPLVSGKKYILSGRISVGTGCDYMLTKKDGYYPGAKQIRVGVPFSISDTTLMQLSFVNNYATGTISANEVMLEEGNKASASWREAPEDVDTRINRAKQEALTAAGAAQNSANSANSAVGNLSSYVDGAFKDSIIDSSEAKAIEKYINIVNTEKAALEATYNKLYANTYLEGAAKTALLNAKVTFFGKVSNLLAAINSAIADGKTSVSEKQNVDAKYNEYKTSLASLQSAIEEANKAIQTKIDALSSQKVNDLKISAENLLPNSAFPLFHANESGTGASTLRTDETEHYYRATPDSGKRVSVYGASFVYATNEEYVSSIYVRQSSSRNVIVILYQHNASTNGYSETVVKSGVWTQIFTKTVKGKGAASSFILIVKGDENAGLALDYKKAQIQAGNKEARGWQPAELDVRTKIAEATAKATEAAAKTQFQTRVDGGLIYTALMKLVDTVTKTETAGISGLPGAAGDLPAFWAGGNYAQALQGLAKAIIRHNGRAKFTDAEVEGAIKALSGQIGNLYIDENGVLYIRDDAGVERFRIGQFDLPALSSLIGNAETATSAQTQSWAWDMTGITNSSDTIAVNYDFPQSLRVLKSGSDITISGQGRMQLGNPSMNGGMEAILRLVLVETSSGASYELFSDALVSTLGGGQLKPFTVNKVLRNMPSGFYKLRAILRVLYSYEQVPPENTCYINVYPFSLSALYQTDLRQIRIGRDGLMVFYGKKKYLYINDAAGEDEPFLRARGIVNIPGVPIEIARLKHNGIVEYSLSGICRGATRTGEGRYTVNLKSGVFSSASDYEPEATAINFGNEIPYPRMAHIINWTASAIYIVTADDDTPNNSGFMIKIYDRR